jgi:hypothetical protein
MANIINYDVEFPPLGGNPSPLPKPWTDRFKKKIIDDVTLTKSLIFILSKDRQLKEDKDYLNNALLVAILVYYQFFNDNLNDRDSLKKLIDTIDKDLISVPDDVYKQLKAIYAYWLYEANLVIID